MARPREFDETEVLDKALGVFWAQGFAHTSISDIEAATGLGRASLYGAFGDKDALFVRVIERYQSKMRTATSGLANATSLRTGLHEFFEDWFRGTCPSNGPKGCILTLSLSADVDIPEIKQRFQSADEQLKKIFASTLLRLSSKYTEHTALDTARALLVFLYGLSAASRAGTEVTLLKSAAHAFVDALCDRPL
jgi:TetR/AcrR family transcriptional regulator, transcriptional repressor for nem operon